VKPTSPISITHRHKLKDEFTFEKSGAVPPGRVMFCRGRSVLGYGDVDDLSRIFEIPKGTNTVCLAAEDIADVREWLG
jgi:hypothetical protein